MNTNRISNKKSTKNITSHFPIDSVNDSSTCFNTFPHTFTVEFQLYATETTA